MKKGASFQKFELIKISMAKKCKGPGVYAPRFLFDVEKEGEMRVDLSIIKDYQAQDIMVPATGIKAVAVKISSDFVNEIIFVGQGNHVLISSEIE